MTDFQIVTCFENLYAAFRASMKGCGNKMRALRFSILALENILLMKLQLTAHTYRVSGYSEFVISEPKRRVIKCGSFRDKVLQHSLCDSLLYPRLRSVFILDNYAGQTGKGTLFGLDRLSEHLRSFYEQYGSDGYILKCDITKYFYSIDHEILKSIIARHFQDEDVQWLCGLFIDSVPSPGVPLGNQSSQVFALLYLNGMDHMIVEELGCERYGRYMDDFYLISNDKEYLRMCLRRIESCLADLHLTLNSKTEIVPVKQGIRFLGFHTYLTKDGTVIRKLTGENKRHQRRVLRRNAALVAAGEMTEKEYYERFDSWKNHASHGNCYNLINAMSKYAREILEESKGGDGDGCY